MARLLAINTTHALWLSRVVARLQGAPGRLPLGVPARQPRLHTPGSSTSVSNSRNVAVSPHLQRARKLLISLHLGVSLAHLALALACTGQLQQQMAHTSTIVSLLSGCGASTAGRATTLNSSARSGSSQPLPVLPTCTQHATPQAGVACQTTLTADSSSLRLLRLHVADDDAAIGLLQAHILVVLGLQQSGG